MDVPALVAVVQEVGLDPPSRRHLVLVFLVVVDLEHAVLGDRGAHNPRDGGVVARGVGDPKPLLRRILAECIDDPLAR